MRSTTILIVLLSTTLLAQQWEVKNHPNSGKKAIVLNGVKISEYIYTEISELSENKAYVAKGGLYAYIDDKGHQQTPYVFAEANNYLNGYTIVGDSFNQAVLNKNCHIVVPFLFARVRLPVQGLILVQGHNGAWGAYDTLGNEKLPVIYDIPPNILSLKHIIVRKEGQYGVINDCNEVVFNTSYQYISSKGFGYKSGKFLNLFTP